MNFITYIQTNREILMSVLFLVISIIIGFLSGANNKKSKIVGTAILSLIGLGITIFLYYDSWQQLILSIFAILAILVIPFIPMVLHNGTVSRNRIGKILYNSTKIADRNDEICMFCGDMDFLGDVSNDKKKNIEYNNQFRQIKDESYSIKVLCLKPDRKDNKKDEKFRLRLGFLKNELGNNIEIKFFNNNECSSEEDCPYKINKSICNQVCICPDLNLRGRLFHLRAGSISVILVTTTESGKKYKITKYTNNSQEGNLYQNLWKILWKNGQIDQDFLKQCQLEYNIYKLRIGD